MIVTVAILAQGILPPFWLDTPACHFVPVLYPLSFCLGTLSSVVLLQGTFLVMAHLGKGNGKAQPDVRAEKYHQGRFALAKEKEMANPSRLSFINHKEMPIPKRSPARIQAEALRAMEIADRVYNGEEVDQKNTAFALHFRNAAEMVLSNNEVLQPTGEPSEREMNYLFYIFHHVYTADSMVYLVGQTEPPKEYIKREKVDFKDFTTLEQFQQIYEATKTHRKDGFVISVHKCLESVVKSTHPNSAALSADDDTFYAIWDMFDELSKRHDM